MMKKIIIILTIIIIQASYFVYLRNKQNKSTPKKQTQLSNVQGSEPKNAGIKSIGNQSPKEKRTKQILTAYQCWQEIKKWKERWKGKATEKTIARYQTYVKQAPNQASFHFILAQIYQSFRSHQDKAYYHFKKVLELAPNYRKSQVIEHWCKLYERQKSRNAKIEKIKKQQDRLKIANNAQEYLKMARIYRKFDLNESAAIAYQDAVKKDPENVALLYEAAMFQKTRYYKESLESFQQILRLKPGHDKKIEIEKYIEQLKQKINQYRYIYEKSPTTENLLTSLKLQLFTDKSQIQKQLAIKRLEKIKAKEAVDLLIEFLKKVKSKRLKNNTLTAIAQIGTEYAYNRLKQLLYSPSNSIELINQILMSFLNKGDKKTIPIIVEWLHHDASRKYRGLGQWVLHEMKTQNKKSKNN